MMTVTDETAQRGLLVRLELGEATDRMVREGFQMDEILAGIASLASDIISTTHNSATASYWFFAMAKNAANIAAREIDPKH